MTTSRQAYCQARGHAWLPWGLWYADPPQFEPMIFASGTKPCLVEIGKHRQRQCERCGARQTEDGAGNIVPEQQ